MWRVFLDTEEYRTLLDSAYEQGERSAREVRLEMRLMAASLRVDTVSRVLYGDFELRDTPEGEKWMLVVEAKDATEREAETRPRAVFIPDDIMAEVEWLAEKRNLDDSDPLFDVSKRTIQRDVTRSAENAATKTGKEDFRKVSAHDLRRYFATHLLFRHEVPSPVVRVLGGWKSDDAMFEYLVLPDDVLFERLGEAKLLETSYDKLHRHDVAEKITATVGRLTELVRNADQDAVREARANLGESATVIDEVTGNGETKRQSDDDGIETRSLSQFPTDTEGIVSPVVAAKLTYLCCVVIISWMVTFGGGLA